MTPKEKITLQKLERELSGAEQGQTLNMMIIRRNTLRQSDDKDRSNRSNYQLKRRWARRGEPAAKITRTTADHLRIQTVKLGEVREDTQPSRPKEGDEHTVKTTNLVRGTGTRCQRARRHRQVVLLNNYLKRSMSAWCAVISSDSWPQCGAARAAFMSST